MSRFPSWHFRSMDLSEVQVDPVHDEFFKAQDLADALVRESIQNSLDARLPRSRSPVRVRFRFAAGAHEPDASRTVRLDREESNQDRDRYGNNEGLQPGIYRR